MRLDFVSLLATDKVQLPGLLYTPKQKTSQVAIWLHGMGDSGIFYNPEIINALGQALTEHGIALLALNNRGAHNSKNLKIIDDRLPEEDRCYQGGTYYELITDCIHDIDGAVAFLRQQQFSTFYLLGHSTGANKICAYHVQTKRNPFSKYILAGPGDDSGLFFSELGEQKFWQALRYAAKHTATEPLRIMPKYTGMYPFSAQSAWDILNPDGAYNTFPFYEATHQRLGKKRLFDEYQQIDLPSLVIFGEEDEYTTTIGGAAKALELMMAHTSNAMLKTIDFTLVPDANHSFDDAEVVFAKSVSDWLADD